MITDDKWWKIRSLKDLETAVRIRDKWHTALRRALRRERHLDRPNISQIRQRKQALVVGQAAGRAFSYAEQIYDVCEHI